MNTGRGIRPVLLAVLLFGCRAGEVELYEPEGSGLASGLTVKVELDSAAVDIAQALGWTDGVPEAEVRLHRIGTDFQWQTALTDSGGAVTFADLLPGQYRLAAYRALSEEEAAELGDRRAFGDGRMIHFGGPSTATLRLAPDERGSLVIGEVYGTSPYVNEVDWDYHPYFEIYNNSDTTIYLDGMILGHASPSYWDNPPYNTCAAMEPFRNDPDGVWAMFFHQFPGSGAEYPLAPGAIAVVAMDGIDHSQYLPTLPDLTHADFELLGSADVDNPAVPNMADVGLTYTRRGHGMELWVGRTLFLSEPVDIEALPRDRPWAPDYDQEVARIPREALLDVLATDVNDALHEQNLPYCHERVHRNFDRLAGGFIKVHGHDLEYSVQRLVIDSTPDGRAILQDTNTSGVDLVRALYTVGTLPERYH
ncbi:MAG: DUF4876 domain-containing protein [Gemmatimonadales bacterium]